MNTPCLECGYLPPRENHKELAKMKVRISNLEKQVVVLNTQLPDKNVVWGRRSFSLKEGNH